MMPLSKVVSHDRCPDCRYRGPQRSGVRSGTGFDGAALWDLTEACIMCAWTITTADVKVGA